MKPGQATNAQILHGFLLVIDWIAHKEYQQRVWIRGEGPEVSDYTETCCCFFFRS